jgi:hypothetical protein
MVERTDPLDALTIDQQRRLLLSAAWNMQQFVEETFLGISFEFVVESIEVPRDPGWLYLSRTVGPFHVRFRPTKDGQPVDDETLEGVRRSFLQEGT